MRGPAIARADIQIRPYRHRDEAGVLALLGAALGGGPTGERLPEFFRWKHFDNPFGSSFMLVAEAEGDIVGLRAFMRWRFVAGDNVFRALRAVDTATHPAYQGRGVFKRLTLRALDEVRGEVDLVFNTPNEKSLPGYLKMGWRSVGKVPITVRVRRPIRFGLGFGTVRRHATDGAQVRPKVDAESAAEALRDAEGVRVLLEETALRDDRLATPRDVEYLRWRYGSAPHLDYRAVHEVRGGYLRGLALFRVRPRGRLWESTIAEVIVAKEDRKTALQLLKRVGEAASVDHVTCRFPARSAATRAAALWGAVRSPLGMTFVVNPLREGIEPDPTDLRSWALSLGDLEVF